MLFHFYNACLNSFDTSYLFSGGIFISLSFLEFSTDTDFGFIMFSAILFPIKSSVASVVLWTTILGAAFASPGFVVTSHNFFPYWSNRFLANDKNPYPLTNILVLGSIENVPFLIINEQCQIYFIFYF